MSSDEYKWSVEIVRSRHAYLNLTFGQAEQILLYEQEYSVLTSSSLSVWEESDYESYVYHRILDSEQFTRYEDARNQHLESYSLDLAEQGRFGVNDLNSVQDLLKFLNEVFLPGFFEDPDCLPFGWLDGEQAKIEFLRAEYQRFLFNEKKQMIADHFRHYRTYKPTSLKAWKHLYSDTNNSVFGQMLPPLSLKWMRLQKEFLDFYSTESGFFSRRKIYSSMSVLNNLKTLMR
ncbi:hypothetical protein [Dyadobacter psychrotolerans]|uniref:Uncharacterized protein n=1 Tax=Dyadobacter psychrotolerans TaxID=2541721 RepID=A0A4R5DLX6_9BACT|nr:hypothetical protein [Dyadobacter psychrotolerans]TDE15266.1 hypothetical protein E0F88_12140 [Dyadobacter psychrotolerans]